MDYQKKYYQNHDNSYDIINTEKNDEINKEKHTGIDWCMLYDDILNDLINILENYKKKNMLFEHISISKLTNNNFKYIEEHEYYEVIDEFSNEISKYIINQFKIISKKIKNVHENNTKFYKTYEYIENVHYIKELYMGFYHLKESEMIKYNVVTILENYFF